MRLVPASVFVTALLLAASAAAQQPPSPVGVDKVRTEPLMQTVPVIGRLVPLRAGAVAARVDAPVAEVLVEVGDRVKVGQALVRLDAEVFDMEYTAAVNGLAEARSMVQTQRARLQLSKLARVRLERLSKTRATAKADADDARQSERVSAAEVAQASAALRAAETAVARAGLPQRYANIVAPYAGVVSERLVETGEYVRAGDDVVRLVGDKLLEVEANVPYERLGGLSNGASVRIVLDDRSEHSATVRGVVPRESTRTRTRPVRFVPTFGDTRIGLAAEQSVTLHVPAGKPRDVLTVHKDAITRRGPAAMVFLVTEGVANPRPVQLGEPVGNRFEVLGGLASGDVVVIRGNERLRPGTAVSFEAPGADAAPAAADSGSTS